MLEEQSTVQIETKRATKIIYFANFHSQMCYGILALMTSPAAPIQHKNKRLIQNPLS